MRSRALGWIHIKFDYVPLKKLKIRSSRAPGSFEIKVDSYSIKNQSGDEI